MANTYPSLSVKGMIYIHSGSPQISVSTQKTTQGTRGRSEDPVYTACGPKICMGTMVYDVFKSQMHNFGPRQVHYKPNTVPDSKPGSIPMMSVSQLRGGSGGGGSSHACTQTLFCLAWDTSIYIYTSIHLYSVRITLKVGCWMKPIRRYRDGKSKHYWPLDIMYIPPDSATCTI